MHSYILCGWHTRSDVPLTGLPALMGDEDRVDVVIEIATDKKPDLNNGRRFLFQHSAERSLIKVAGIAVFEIIGGRKIRVWPESGIPLKDIEIFLYGQAWATLCHQRGILPLHASAVSSKEGLVGFAGHSGAGKSTAAASLASAGYELIADDIVPISFTGGSAPGAWPYLRRLKLTDEMLSYVGLTSTDKVSENLDVSKYFVCLKPAQKDEWRRLDRIYVLERDSSSSDISIQKLSGAEAVRALVDHTYHFQFIVGAQRWGKHLAVCARLAAGSSIYRLRVPNSESRKKLASRIHEHLNYR